jgi:hypothetical protein
MHRIDVLGDGKGKDEPITMRAGDASKGTFKISN